MIGVLGIKGRKPLVRLGLAPPGPNVQAGCPGAASGLLPEMRHVPAPRCRIWGAWEPSYFLGQE
jgi:hypothetical protein